uniref:Uncharacterized protein LOC8280413 n=1 Tax=Rhizophora mucronata TaxID=61149 RepID=A0A2P2M184_RHIMU
MGMPSQALLRNSCKYTLIPSFCLCLHFQKIFFFLLLWRMASFDNNVLYFFLLQRLMPMFLISVLEGVVITLRVWFMKMPISVISIIAFLCRQILLEPIIHN